jgi:hypothetical protein
MHKARQCPICRPWKLTIFESGLALASATTASCGLVAGAVTHALSSPARPNLPSRRHPVASAATSALRLCVMSKKRLINWLVYRLGGARAAQIGIVKATDADAAIAAAIIEYDLPAHDRKRLIARLN